MSATGWAVPKAEKPRKRKYEGSDKWIFLTSDHEPRTDAEGKPLKYEAADLTPHEHRMFVQKAHQAHGPVARGLPPLGPTLVSKFPKRWQS